MRVTLSPDPNKGRKMRALAVVAAAFLVGVSVVQSASLRVSTFNVLCQACALTDEGLPFSELFQKNLTFLLTDYYKWDVRLTHFEQLFARQPCDIYGIQELMHRGNVQQILDILPSSYLPIYYNHVRRRASSSFSHGVSLTFAASADVGRILLPGCHDLL